MYCQNCGNQIDEKATTCIHCGHAIAKSKPAMSSGVVILLLIIFFPVGLYFMWAKTNWSKVAKIIVTVAIAFIALISITQTEPNTNQDNGGSTPSYSDTQNDHDNDATDATIGTTEPVDPYKDAVVVSPEDLFAAYDSNEVAADNKYKGQTLKITGSIKEIGKDVLDQVYITFDSGDLIFRVQCYFKKDQLDIVAELAKEQTITLVGTCSGKSMNILIKDCVIIDQ